MEESWGTKEFKACGVEDKREAKSVARMADQLLAHPESSFSGSVGTGLRKAAWRIFSKEEVDLSCGHYQQTALRCQQHTLVLVSQDTTDLSFPGHTATQGLGDLGGGGGKGVNPGLSLHTAMALTPGGLPLGVVGQKLWAPLAKGREQYHYKYALEEKESYCWVEALQWAGHYLSKAEKVLILSDRDSDFYEYMKAERAGNVELLLRVHHLTRMVYFEGRKQYVDAIRFSASTQAEVFLAKTKDRKERIATLEVSWGKIICPAPKQKKGEAVVLWVVKAEELAPPAGEAPLKWVLLTSMPVEEASTALSMVDYYRMRWIIERWHYVLKQGLQVERLQFDCYQRLSNAIALVSIVAWQLLCLKYLAAENPEAAAEEVLEPLQVEVLQRQQGVKGLTLKQALIAIAALAGFVPSKKQPLPGEKTIWKGWFIFDKLCEGYKLALQKSYGTG
jgi:hypothetical protein